VNQEIRRYQRLFREVNLRIAEINASGGTPEFLCECGRQDCIEAIALDLGEFRQVTREQDVFVVAPSHGVEGIDLLVESREGYDLVALEDGGR
jgi:hypothetical protein